VKAVKTVLIIGGSGFVGSHLALKLREHYKVFITYKENPIFFEGITSYKANAAERVEMQRVIFTSTPNIVIFCAGNNKLPPPGLKQKEIENFNRWIDYVHAGGPSTVLDVSNVLKPKFIYISNWFVFEGKRGNYKETDTTVTSNALGRAKLNAENYIRGKSLDFVSIRSSPLYGVGPVKHPSELDQFIQVISSGKRFEVEDTEIHSFAPIDAFTDFVAQIINLPPGKKNYHFGGLTKIDKYSFYMRFAERFGLDKKLIQKKERKDYVVEPSDYSLNVSKIINELNIKPLLLEEGFDLLEKKLIASL